MLYLLMHKNDTVASFLFNTNNTINEHSIKVINPTLLPIGANSRSKLALWWQDRAIPNTRSYIKYLLKYYMISTSLELCVKNLGLSLTDSYWIKPSNTDKKLNWESVNLYTNKFVDNNSLISLGNNNMIKCNRKLAPASSQGELEKFWTIAPNGEIFLVKGNYSYKIQQSLNELFATKILEFQNWNDYVSYNLIDIISDEEPSIGCCCKSYTSENVEAITFFNLLRHFNKTTSQNLYNDLIDICVNLGLDRAYVKDFLDREIALDYVITNLDRHMNNISILRDSNTLKVSGLAPMYDFGNSMFFRCNVPSSIPSGKALSKLETHSFNNIETKLLRHVDKSTKFNLEPLYNRELFDSVYDIDTTKDKDFYDALYKTYIKKLDMFRNYMK